MQYVFAFPFIKTLSFLLEQYNFPFLFDNWIAVISFLFRILLQYGINEQWAEPVTGSSRIVAWGVKNLETKSELSPGAETITPPGLRLILLNISVLIEISSISFWLL